MLSLFFFSINLCRGDKRESHFIGNLPKVELLGQLLGLVLIMVAGQLSPGGAHEQNGAWTTLLSCLMLVLIAEGPTC